MYTFRDVKVWEKSHHLSLHIHKLTAVFPPEELMGGLATEMRKASLLVSGKIADGCGRGSDKDLARCLSYAQGHAAALDTLTIISRDLGYLSPDDYAVVDTELTEIQKMLYGFLRVVKARLAEKGGERSGDKADEQDAERLDAARAARA